MCFGQGFSEASAPFLLSTSSLRKGLVGYWRLEESSSTRYDCSSTGNHLSANNSPGNILAKQTYGVTLVSASSQFLTSPSTNTYQFTAAQPFSLACWVKLTNSGANQTIMSKFQASTTIGFYLVANAGKLHTGLHQSGTISRTKTATTVITNATWHHVAMTYNGNGSTNGISLYVDGAADTISAVGSAGTFNGSMANSVPFTVGTYWNGGSQAEFANGIIDELSIHNRVLSSTEVSKLYNSGSGTHFPWAHP